MAVDGLVEEELVSGAEGLEEDLSGGDPVRKFAGVAE